MRTLIYWERLAIDCLVDFLVSIDLVLVILVGLGGEELLALKTSLSPYTAVLSVVSVVIRAA